jgi:hypothetical protein
MSLLVGANLALWLSSRLLGFATKDHGTVFFFVIIIDICMLLGFALLGLLTGWLLAFRPEAFKQSIGRSIAKQNARKISN